MFKLQNLLKSYNAFMISYPLLGNATTAGVGMGIGNLLCQIMMYPRDKQIDLIKTMQYTAFGFLVSGPILRYWWYALDLKIFATASARWKPLKMMLLDQATTPYLLNGSFLYFLARASGESHEASFADVKQRLVPIVFESYKVWPLATLVNFYLIPLHNRVLFSNALAILWITYFTYLVSTKSAVQ